MFQSVVRLPFVERGRRQGQDTIGIDFAELLRQCKSEVQPRRTG
ncbi:hypothetical protein [Xenorhabdus sp. PB30.3]|nr:hypothetical protein [Xenorhabdus sp. PB30.3]